MHTLVTREDAARLFDEAEALRAADQPAAAIAKLERALRHEGPLDPVLLGEITLRLVDCLTEVNDHTGAQAAVTPFLEEAPDELWRARSKVRLARAKYYLGDLDAAIGFGRDALRVLAHTNLHAETAMALQWLGTALQESGRVSEASETFRDAVALARLAEDPGRHASGLGSLGRLKVQQSEYRDARRLFEECLSLMERSGRRKNVARTLLNLSVCSLYLGDWARAEEEAERALRLFRELGDERGMAQAKLALCRLARRQRADARPLLEEASELAERCDFRRARLIVIYERADIAREAGRLHEAAEEYGRLLELARPEAPGGDITYAGRRSLALVHLAEGRFSAAERLAAQALRDASRACDARESALCRVALAGVHNAVGRRERAGEEIEEAIQVLERLETPYELAEAHETAAAIFPGAVTPGHRERARQLRASLGLEAAPRRIERTEIEFVAVAPRSRNIVATAHRIGSLDVTVLLKGETGVGKTLVARLIHDAGPRKREPFAVLQCAGWSERRMEGGSAPDPAVLFESTARGTVLLHNVDKAAPTLQEQLIGALESSGSTTRAAVEDRPPHVISTTCEDLQQLVGRGRFLGELYYRLTGFVLEIPPLRERSDDIDELAERIAGRRLPEEVLAVLRQHTWPGNVRELRSVLQGALFLAGDAPLSQHHLPDSVKAQEREPSTLPERIEVLERREIREILERTGNNKLVAARELGVSRKGLIDRLKRLGMWEEYGRKD